MSTHSTLVSNNKIVKLVSETAEKHSESDLMALAALMGPGEDEGNPHIPAGYTYLGQFIDHDITLTKENITNGRTPFFDLDSLYGNGADIDKNGIFVIGNSNNINGDLSRDDDFVAKIPEGRNDENIIVASIHLLFQKFHNKLVDQHNLSFEDAKRTVTWHYQSMVVHDFLPKIVGTEIMQDILRSGRKLYQPTVGSIFMPTEFSGACYRFGHSMVREKYSFNDNFKNTLSNDNLFFGFCDGRPKGKPSNSDPRLKHLITEVWTLQGGGKTFKGEANKNSLKRFFDPSILSESNADNLSGKIDTKLPPILFNLEVPTGESNILAFRNLNTGQNLKLPNGQQVAEFFKSKSVPFIPLTHDEIKTGDSNGIKEVFLDNTPLWFYVLRESEVRFCGHTLGVLGGRIVAETFLGILELDQKSLLHKNNMNESWPFKISGVTDDNKVSMINIIDFVDN